ncbi:hypothetical protein [Halocatena salina]|uniref:Uncharacterized protein n=1 Tax=Halocatena salina TaxID=2934340 RepID=A0A8U0A623_9EURY|nr:hypothetical protein [Halocatena salina]UPM43367.1 hypothetical protein MW046_02710 [Halocatena salina]
MTMTGYYDFVLGVIPLSLFGVSGVLTVVGVETTLSVLVAASIAVAFMGHALFVRTPTDQEPAEQLSTDQSTERSARVETNPVRSD